MIALMAERKSETEDEICMYEFDFCTAIKENGKLREIKLSNRDMALKVKITKTINIDFLTSSGNKFTNLSVNKENSSDA